MYKTAEKYVTPFDVMRILNLSVSGYVLYNICGLFINKESHYGVLVHEFHFTMYYFESRMRSTTLILWLQVGPLYQHLLTDERKGARDAMIIGRGNQNTVIYWSKTARNPT
jgi:hypothetical protein